MNRSFFKILICVVVLAVAMPALATNTNVDMELSLVVDVSGSVDTNEFTLQRTGYVNAFNNPSLWTAISQGAFGQIAVNFIYFSGSGQQDMAVGWTLIDSQTAMTSFAAAIGATTRPYSGLTGVGDAVEFATDSFTNSFDGTRLVIDVSGDGCTNDGVSTATGRTYAVNNGVTAINGLVIQPTNPCDYPYLNANVLDEYTKDLVTTNGFVGVANDFGDFGTAVDAKIIREVHGVPEPGSVALLACGLLGLAGLRRKPRN